MYGDDTDSTIQYLQTWNPERVEDDSLVKLYKFYCDPLESLD